MEDTECSRVQCDRCGRDMASYEVNEAPVAHVRYWIVCPNCLSHVLSTSAKYAEVLLYIKNRAEVDKYRYKNDSKLGPLYASIESIISSTIEKIATAYNEMEEEDGSNSNSSAD